MSPSRSERPPCVLVIGCGSIGQRHIGNLCQLGVVRILVHDPDVARMEAVVAKQPVQTCATIEEAYRAKPQAVLVCAPSRFHLSIAREAILHDCDVFVEKPLSHTLDGVDEVLELAHARGRIIMLGYNMRFNPCGLQIKAWLDDHRIGRVISARLHVGSYLPWRHPWEDYRIGYGAQQALGGGVLLDAIHELDYAVWLFGVPEEVFCLSGHFSDLEVDTEDVAELLFRYPDRKVVSIHLDYLQRPHQRWCELIGGDGVIHMDFVKGRGRLVEGDSRKETPFESPFQAGQDYVEEMRHFLACVARRAVPPADGVVGRQSLVIARAAHESALKHQPVALASYLTASRSGVGRLAEVRTA